MKPTTSCTRFSLPVKFWIPFLFLYLIMPKKQNKQTSRAASARAKKQTRAIVVARPPRQRAAMAGGRASSEYLAALISPFSDRALGARVPDMFSVPTIPLKLEGVFVLQSSPAGNISTAFNFHPLLALMDPLASSVVSSPTGPYGTAGNTIFPLIRLAQLAPLVANWRVVGAGLQLANVIPELACTGRLIVAPSTTSAHIPNVRLLDNSGGAPFVSNVISDIFGVPTNSFTGSGLPTTILSLPEAVDVTMQQLIASHLCFTSRPQGPLAMNFRTTANETNVAASLSDGFVPITGTGTGNASLAEMPDLVDNSGFAGVLIRAEGLPANTGSIELKYIIHLEGTPSVTANNMLPSMHGKSVDMGSFHRALEEASRRPMITMIPAARQSRIFGKF